MTDRDSFLSAILAAPDDDTPRLVYADWLDDQGEAELAEFIRVQCELAFLGKEWIDFACGCGRDDPRFKYEFEWLDHRDALRRRERELTESRHAIWATFCEPMCGLGTGFTWAMRRGFVESIACSWPDCRDHLDAIRRVQPVRRVRLTTMPIIPAQWVGDDEQHPDYWHRTEELFLARRWPGVEFELPKWPDSTVGLTTVVSDSGPGTWEYPD